MSPQCSIISTLIHVCTMNTHHEGCVSVNVSSWHTNHIHTRAKMNVSHISNDYNYCHNCYLHACESTLCAYFTAVNVVVADCYYYFHSYHDHCHPLLCLSLWSNVCSIISSRIQCCRMPYDTLLLFSQVRPSTIAPLCYCTLHYTLYAVCSGSQFGNPRLSNGTHTRTYTHIYIIYR